MQHFRWISKISLDRTRAVALAAVFRLALILILGRHTTGYVFDFHVIETHQSFADSELLCQDLGYDGLAVLSSPEAFNLALRLTEHERSESDKGFYIGLRYDVDRDLEHWDDGTLPASDTPWKNGQAGQGRASDPCGLFTHKGNIKWHSGTGSKHAICGNHTALSTEAHGSSAIGQKPMNVSSRLSVVQISSYQECVLLCGMDHRCRVAQFNSNQKTCMTLEAGTYIDFTTDGTSNTFIRNGFA